ncbi:hypothetical protein N801_10800 [Knoellia aerolata DSM 18566]|uniref:Uncharacterized protein n=1 Tax=Knoellia aerolata DSM 18566 TaxID=1385519 RepID=A0A0A0JXS0_9MICO|nr:hypothetical protein N801_10800 [Knoellia aerolata DSM 18566]
MVGRRLAEAVTPTQSGQVHGQSCGVHTIWVIRKEDEPAGEADFVALHGLGQRRDGAYLNDRIGVDENQNVSNGRLCTGCTSTAEAGVERGGNDPQLVDFRQRANPMVNEHEFVPVT